MFETLASVLARFTTEAYYVGGCVRDCLLGRPIRDVDIAVAADPQAVGRAVAEALGAHFFWLREQEGTARVFRNVPDMLQVDIIGLTEPIERDLRRRDFTINAMAVPVAVGLRSDAPVFDPTGGQADLKAQRLRLASEGALEADPVRTLRGVRLSVQLGFELEPETARRIRAAAPWLARVSRERIRDEFFLCLARPPSREAVERLRDFALLEEVLPELRPLLASGPWDAALALLEAVERLTSELPFEPALAAEVGDRLNRALTPPRERRALLKLAALLWHLPETGTGTARAERSRRGPLRKVAGAAGRVGRQLALSVAEASWLERLLAHRRLPQDWWREGALVGRAVYRFWRSARNAAADVVLFALAESADAEEVSALAGLLARLLEYERGQHPPLLSGEVVMAITGLTPGPALGRLLEELAEAQADGAVRTPGEARVWVARRATGASGEEAEEQAG